MTIWANRLYPRAGAVRAAPSGVIVEEPLVPAGRGKERLSAVTNTVESLKPYPVEHRPVVYQTIHNTEHNPVVYRETIGLEENSAVYQTAYHTAEHSAVYGGATNNEYTSAVYEGDTNTEHHSTMYQGDSNTTTHSAVYHNTDNTEKSQTVYHTEVRVDVVNHNQIKSGEDMEALAERFADALRERIFSAAEGVYA